MVAKMFNQKAYSLSDRIRLSGLFITNGNRYFPEFLRKIILSNIFFFFFLSIKSPKIQVPTGLAVEDLRATCRFEKGLIHFLM